MLHDPSAMNRRMRRELHRIGFGHASVLPLANCTPKLLYLMTTHLERVMKSTPVGILKRKYHGQR